MAPTIHHGTLRAFNAGTYLARLTLRSSIHMSLNDVPTSRDIAAGEMLAGRSVAVIIFDETKATDAIVVAVWT